MNCNHAIIYLSTNVIYRYVHYSLYIQYKPLESTYFTHWSRWSIPNNIPENHIRGTYFFLKRNKPYLHMGHVTKIKARASHNKKTEFIVSRSGVTQLEMLCFGMHLFRLFVAYSI